MLIDSLVVGIVIIVAITFHEFAHAYVATKLGDPTPKIQGRVTINPIKHIDLLGFVLLLTIGFGWGKPVQIKTQYFSSRLRDELLVALAGPFTNLLIGYVSALGLLIYAIAISGYSRAELISILTVRPVYSNIQDGTIAFLYILSVYNILLTVLNLLPIPPLDGYRIIQYIIPYTENFLKRYQLFFGLILLFIIFYPPLKFGSFIISVSHTIFRFIISHISFII